MAALEQAVPRRRFSVSDDIKLLREVNAEDPFKNPSKWNVILENLRQSANKDFTLRSIKERLDLLMVYFMRQDRANLRK